uniref:Uncharacterized protein n=1 Tax=Rhizophora mucronata TaxID=61149 RepID=A0A2P2NWL7_RHIMU
MIHVKQSEKAEKGN